MAELSRYEYRKLVNDVANAVVAKLAKLGGGQRGIDAFCEQSGMCQARMLNRESVERLYK